MELTNNQFLKVRNFHGCVEFEVFEQPPEKWRRPLRWRLLVPKMQIVNRHKKESRIARVVQAVEDVKRGFKTGF